MITRAAELQRRFSSQHRQVYYAKVRALTRKGGDPEIYGRSIGLVQ